jgi:hypothetical protein
MTLRELIAEIKKLNSAEQHRLNNSLSIHCRPIQPANQYFRN